MATMDNLAAAFAGESQANRKYLAFAQKAEAEGFAQIAKLFRAAAAAETVHAHTHLRVMGGIKDTAANLQEAIEGEHHEFTSMYPEFLTEAESEDNKPAIHTIKNAMAVEEIHHRMYTDALASLNSGTDLADRDVFVCDVCGNTVYGEAPEKCPICGVPHERFTKID